MVNKKIDIFDSLNLKTFKGALRAVRGKEKFKQDEKVCCFLCLFLITIVVLGLSCAAHWGYFLTPEQKVAKHLRVIGMDVREIVIVSNAKEPMIEVEASEYGRLEDSLFGWAALYMEYPEYKWYGTILISTYGNSTVMYIERDEFTRMMRYYEKTWALVGCYISLPSGFFDESLLKKVNSMYGKVYNDYMSHAVICPFDPASRLVIKKSPECKALFTD